MGKKIPYTKLSLNLLWELKVLVSFYWLCKFILLGQKRTTTIVLPKLYVVWQHNLALQPDKIFIDFWDITIYWKLLILKYGRYFDHNFLKILSKHKNYFFFYFLSYKTWLLWKCSLYRFKKLIIKLKKKLKTKNMNFFFIKNNHRYDLL